MRNHENGFSWNLLGIKNGPNVKEDWHFTTCSQVHHDRIVLPSANVQPRKWLSVSLNGASNQLKRHKLPNWQTCYEIHPNNLNVLPMYFIESSYARCYYFLLVFSMDLISNIARGTTDPGYRIYNLNKFSGWHIRLRHIYWGNNWEMNIEKWQLRNVWHKVLAKGLIRGSSCHPTCAYFIDNWYCRYV